MGNRSPGRRVFLTDENRAGIEGAFFRWEGTHPPRWEPARNMYGLEIRRVRVAWVLHRVGLSWGRRRRAFVHGVGGTTPSLEVSFRQKAAAPARGTPPPT